MAGFFGFFDYTKPGPGVPDPEDAPPKARILVFFEIFSRKFWNLIKINMMFLLFNIPALIAAFIATHYLFQSSLMPLASEELPAEFLAQLELIIRFILASVLMCIPVITLGPAQAGFTYLLRNYSREEHAFIWSDFKEHALKNLKQSMIVCVIDLVVILVMGVALNFYAHQTDIISSLANGFLLLALGLFFIMHMYIYPMMVTFKLSTKQLYRNALLFTIMKLLPNVGIAILCVILVLLPYVICFATGLNPVLAMLVQFLLMFSLIGLITNFYVYPKLKKYIMDKVEEEEE